jgi:chemotaxis protein MotB
MSGSRDAAAEELVLIKRYAHEDDHHHGGVWKIAYADFMTAMMAFFLVMWLINAANTETKASVASYFNPVKLTDNVPRPKGLHDPTDRARQPNTPPKPHDKAQRHKAAEGASPEKDRGKASGNDGKNAPNDRGDKQVAERSPASASDSPAAGREGAGAMEFGTAFRDPFNTKVSTRVGADPDPSIAAQAKAELDQADVDHREGVAQRGSNATTEARTQHGVDGKARERGSPEHSREEQLAEMADAVRRDLEALALRIGSVGPGIHVSIESGLIVVSLTDTANFGMFAVGSAEPSAKLTELVQGLAPIVMSRSDGIIIRGHTDSRPYRGDKRSNNWRLAMARADTAQTLLVKAGIDDAHIDRIESHADRLPKDPRDPEAAVNRRIDILLRRGSSR